VRIPSIPLSLSLSLSIPFNPSLFFVHNTTQISLLTPGPPVDALLAPYPFSAPLRDFLQQVFGDAFLLRLRAYILGNLGGPPAYNCLIFPTNSPRCKYVVFVKWSCLVQQHQAEKRQPPSHYEAMKSALLGAMFVSSRNRQR
jgi:hypothetical protein